MSPTEEKISSILQSALQSEENGDDFYNDLIYANVDEHYLENMLKEKQK